MMAQRTTRLLCSYVKEPRVTDVDLARLSNGNYTYRQSHWGGSGLRRTSEVYSWIRRPRSPWPSFCSQNFLRCTWSLGFRCCWTLQKFKFRVNIRCTFMQCKFRDVHWRWKKHCMYWTASCIWELRGHLQSRTCSLKIKYPCGYYMGGYTCSCCSRLKCYRNPSQCDCFYN